MKQLTFFIFFSLILSLPVSIFAVEVAPRISDREIIEKLAGLEAGQAALRSEIKSGQTALRSEMKSGQAALGKRIDDMNQRISSQQTTMLALFSSIAALILALFAYIAWDRRTMLKPVVERLEHLEKNVMRDLDINHKDGSLLTRLVMAMRELAKQDKKVASVLRSFSLL